MAAPFFCPFLSYTFRLSSLKKLKMNELSADWLRIVWSAISGVFMTILGYFIPIKDIFLLLMLFFVVDVIFGYWAAHKLRNEKFSQKIIWKTTMPRMLITLVLILCAYMWDDVYGQTTVATYNVIGWFISGILLASIAINGHKITNWDVFLGLGKYFTRKVSESGIEVPQNNQTEKA